MANSQASVSVEDDSRSRDREDGLENVSTGSNNMSDGEGDPVRRKRWTFLLRKNRDDDSTTGKARLRALTVSCRCKGAVKGSCLIISASFIELLGNLISLVYGISYIMSAINFYELDSDPEKRDKEYNEQLHHVFFLEQNGTAFIGLMAICAIGLFISILMPIGTIYKSWKCIRTSMSLLFSMIFFHAIILGVYLCDNELTATAAAIPFRVYELFLLYSYIRYYKKKRLEEIRSGKRKVCGPYEVNPTSQELLSSTSLVSIKNQARLEKKSSEIQATFDMLDGSIRNQNIMLPEGSIIVGDTKALFGPGQKDKTQKKKNKLFSAWQEGNKKEHVHYSPMIPDRYIEYK